MSDIAATYFSDEEIAAAPWVHLRAWSHGYPEPSGDGSYRAMTYDLRSWCERCDQGGQQNAPFRMRSESRWGRRGIMQLFWISDEIFVTPAVWATVFQPRGIACRPVVNHRGIALERVVQLVIDDEIGIIPSGQGDRMCTKCLRIKYGLRAGYYPALAEQPRAAVARTREFFGNGAGANRFVVISQDVVRALRDANVRGATYSLLRPDAISSDTALS